MGRDVGNDDRSVVYLPKGGVAMTKKLLAFVLFLGIVVPLPALAQTSLVRFEG